MLPPQHRLLAGSDLDPKRVASRLPQLAHEFARQVLNEESDIAWDDNVQRAASVFVKAVGELEPNRYINVWRRLLVFVSFKFFCYINSAIYQHIICSTLFMSSRKQPCQCLKTALAFETGHV